MFKKVTDFAKDNPIIVIAIVGLVAAAAIGGGYSIFGKKGVY